MKNSRWLKLFYIAEELHQSVEKKTLFLTMLLKTERKSLRKIVFKQV